MKKERFKDLKVYWISSEPQAEIQAFYKAYKFENLDFQFLEDREGFQYTEFNVSSTPTIMQFSPQGTFVREFPDDAPVGYILDQILKGEQADTQ